MSKKYRRTDSKKRSLTKSVTYRLLTIVSDVIITFAISHRYDITAGFVIFTNLASALLYYLHERLWAKI